MQGMRQQRGGGGGTRSVRVSQHGSSMRARPHLTSEQKGRGVCTNRQRSYTRQRPTRDPVCMCRRRAGTAHPHPSCPAVGPRAGVDKSNILAQPRPLQWAGAAPAARQVLHGYVRRYTGIRFLAAALLLLLTCRRPPRGGRTRHECVFVSKQKKRKSLFSLANWDAAGGRSEDVVRTRAFIPHAFAPVSA
jgi:hypothetical protein